MSAYNVSDRDKIKINWIKIIKLTEINTLRILRLKGKCVDDDTIIRKVVCDYY